MTHTHDAISGGLDLENSVKGKDPSVPDLVIQVMQEDGIDISKQTRKLVTKEMIDAVDKVVVITDYPLPEFIQESPKVEYWREIPDAVRTPLAFHREVRDMVRERIRELAERVG